VGWCCSDWASAGITGTGPRGGQASGSSGDAMSRGAGQGRGRLTGGPDVFKIQFEFQN
jgi:hypothetical protein